MKEEVFFSTFLPLPPWAFYRTLKGPFPLPPRFAIGDFFLGGLGTEEGQSRATHPSPQETARENETKIVEKRLVQNTALHFIGCECLYVCL